MTLGMFLVTFGFAKDIEEADTLCERGSVRVNGNIAAHVYQTPSPGSIVGTLESSYTVMVPHFEYSDVHGHYVSVTRG